MRKLYVFASLFLLLLTFSCTKESTVPSSDLDIRATIGEMTRISYSDNVEGQSVALAQQWQAGDRIIGWCNGKRFCYEVSSVSSGVAFLSWFAGDQLEGDESGVIMYFAPGHNFSDIDVSDGSLDFDISQQSVGQAMPAILKAIGNFVDKSLVLNFSNYGAVLRLDRLCHLPSLSKVSAVKVYGAVATSDGVPSVITYTKQGGWNTNAFGEMSDTIRIAMLPSSSASEIIVKAEVGDTEYQAQKAVFQVFSGKYYYPAPIAVRMVSGSSISYYRSIGNAVEAANGSEYDAALTLFLNQTISNELTFNNPNHKISLDLADCVLTGKNSILSKVEFFASGDGYAMNDGNVVLVGGGGDFSIKGSQLSSSSTKSDYSAAPLAINGSTGSTGKASVDGTYINGNTTYGAAYVKIGELTIDGDATLTSKRALFVTSDGNLTVNGGTITSTSSSHQSLHIGGAASVININGGSFISSGNLFNFNSPNVAQNAVLNISGGRFKWSGVFSTAQSQSVEGEKVSVTGGLFSQELTYGVAEGYKCVENTDPLTANIYPYKVQ